MVGLKVKWHYFLHKNMETFTKTKGNENAGGRPGVNGGLETQMLDMVSIVRN